MKRVLRKAFNTAMNYRLGYFVVLYALLLHACQARKAITFQPTREIHMTTCSQPAITEPPRYDPVIEVEVHAVKDSSGTGIPDSILVKHLVFTLDTINTGHEGLIKTLRRFIRYPEYEKELGISGTIVLSSRVMRTGMLAGPVTLKAVKYGPGLEKEAKRALNSCLIYISVKKPAKFHALNFLVKFRLDPAK